MNASDRAAAQGALLGWQGQREFTSAGQGRRRQEIFRAEIRGAEEPPPDGYAPTEQFASLVQGLIRCDFGFAFLEPPMMKAAVALKHHDMNSLALEENQPQEFDPDYQPVVQALVVNWRRAEKHRIYGGADVRFRVHDHPWRYKMIVTLRFSGPSIATPLTDQTWVDTTTRTT